MLLSCPYCDSNNHSSGNRPALSKAGSYSRKSDGEVVQRYKCRPCKRYFSDATTEKEFGQNKRQINSLLNDYYCSNMSQRRIARILKIDLKTVARKVQFLGAIAKEGLRLSNFVHNQCLIVEFDDLETFEHTKCKPLSVTMAVEHKSRRILGFEVSEMPAHGMLAQISVKKYGRRKDGRSEARKKLFKDIVHNVKSNAIFKSDQHPGYPKELMNTFPHCKHQRYKGRKAASIGQGELKVGGFDPLFSLNHTFASYRANINRLNRKTWNTTKDKNRLADHIAMYSLYHNLNLKKKSK